MTYFLGHTQNNYIKFQDYERRLTLDWIPTGGPTQPYLCDGYEHISYGEGEVKLA